MKLLDNEIRDIIKCLEAGKPLPDQKRGLSLDGLLLKGEP